MSNVQVQFKRGDATTINNTPITDGIILFDTQNQKIYMDNGSERIEYYNDMSHFMNKTTIDNLINKLDAKTYLQQAFPTEINKVIGDTTKIGNVPIIDAVDNLYQSKSLFIPLWQDTIHEAFDTKTVEVSNTYPFFIISFGSYELEYDEDDPFDEGTLVWHQDDDNGTNLSKYYNIVLNDSVIYTNRGEFITNSIVSDVRKIQITSDTTHNTTTFYFDRYGKYYNGNCVESTQNNKKIPFFIMGITTY